MESLPQRKTIILVVYVLVVFFVFVGTVTYVWAQRYEGRLAPNVFIDPVEVSGLEPETARRLLQTKIDQILLKGLDVRVGETTRTLSLTAVMSGDSIEDVEYNLSRAMEEASNVQLFTNIWKPVHIPLVVEISEENVKQNITRLFPDKETPAQNARFIIEPTEGGLVVLTTPETPGTVFNWELFFDKLTSQLKHLDQTEIELSLIVQAPEVTRAQAEIQKNQAEQWLSRTSPQLIYTDEKEKKFEWQFPDGVFLPIIPQANGEIGLDRETLDAFFNLIATEIERPAQDARIQIENGRVVDFVESKNGLHLDRNGVQKQIVQYFKQKNDDPITLAVLVEEPAIQTADVNDLGIDQILGTGTSSYRGSPLNRRKNIQNGVNLLNGILIPPDETFSLLNALKPFDAENGYLPELVIKGNKITPELGGGLCQIGTTTFRATMHSGLPILERQNHSIVVSYYNDPTNKNPGTDATIYEPAPDFKFLNDTGHYILFQAENLVDTQELRFTFWGTSDGRKGSYVPPTVIRWIPVGEPETTESTDLKPGEEKCQEAHIGADASFDYTIVRSDGTEETITYTSHYRPLPRICLVGITTPIAEENLSTEPVLQKETE